MTTDPRPVSTWLADLPRIDLHPLYPDSRLAEERRSRLRATLARYQASFGDDPVRVFRAPGRINLRGMHVDTHGGWLNLMTHQREVIVIAGASPDGAARVVNTDPSYQPLVIQSGELPQIDGPSWTDFITSPETIGRIAAAPGHWRNYIEGAWLRTRFAMPHRDISGLRLVVDSNLPQGAALSSSAALCIALLHAWLAWNGMHFEDDDLILAAQDAEWYTGSRCGTCDQAAIVLGRPGALIHASLYPKEFTTRSARAIPLPERVRILVINSFTRRSISGAEKIAYTRNRFAYSMAMEIFQQALRSTGYPESLVKACGRLSAITPDTLGGHGAIYDVLRQIPECADLADLRQRFNLPEFDREYRRYFGDVPPDLQPRDIHLRGPLLFGIAESERARHFASALESGDDERAGRLMTIGHDGDRRVDCAGNPFQSACDDAALVEWKREDRPIETCPGVYGASSPALDALVDAALKHGALGASLTGAGIAGTVLALCDRESAASVADGVRRFMASTDYTRIAELKTDLSPTQRNEAVLENSPCAGAGEVVVAG